MPQPQAPPTRAPYVDGAKIIDQRLDAAGNVLVTFALPGLTTAVVRMPYSSWVSGDAHLMGPLLVRMIRQDQ